MTCSRDSAESEHALASTRRQKVNMLSRAFRKSTCSCGTTIARLNKSDARGLLISKWFLPRIHAMSSPESKIAKRKRTPVSSGERTHALKSQRLRKEQNAGFKRGTETCSREKAGSEYALASIRYQKVNMVSRSCTKVTCSLEHTIPESAHVLASIR